MSAGLGCGISKMPTQAVCDDSSAEAAYAACGAL